MKHTIRTHGGKVLAFLFLCVALLSVLCVTALAAPQVNSECPGYDSHEFSSMPTANGRQHYYVCRHCRLRVEEPHTYTDWTSNGDGLHIGTCACGLRAALPCSGGAPTCTSPAICTTCHAPYGESLSTNHEYGPVWISGKTTHYYACLHCGERRDEQPHEYSEPVSAGNGTHVRTCACGKIVLERCSGGEATCVSPAVCTACQAPYGEIDRDNHAYSTDWVQDETTHYYNCGRCGNKASEAEHVYADWTSTGDGIHTGTCLCGKTHTEDCTGGKATCKHPATCTVCEKPYGAMDPTVHVYPDGVWERDPTGHWAICLDCGESTGRIKHEWGPDRYCTVCGMVETNFVSITVEGGRLAGTGLTSAVVELFSSVTIVADKAPVGQIFVGWEANGKPIDKTERVTFYATMDTAIRALYEADPNYVPPETTPETTPGVTPETTPNPPADTTPSETTPPETSAPAAPVTPSESENPFLWETEPERDNKSDGAAAIILGGISLVCIIAMVLVILYRERKID